MGTRSDLNGANIFENLLRQGNKFEVGRLNDAAQALSLKMQPVLFSIPTAGRTYTMPAVTVADDGAFFLICNFAATAIDVTINNAAASAIGTISQNEAGLVICVNGAWRVVLVGTST